MKKYSLLFTLLMVSIVTFAQNNVSFQVNKYGRYEIPDSYNDFYVISFSGYSQTQLYTTALKAITKAFVSANCTINKVDNEMISVSSIHRFTETYGHGVISLTYDVYYNFEIEFKEGRIKVNAPQIVKIIDHYGDLVSFRDCATSSTTGEVLAASQREFSFVNNIINTVLRYMYRNNDNW